MEEKKRENKLFKNLVREEVKLELDVSFCGS